MPDPTSASADELPKGQEFAALLHDVGSAVRLADEMRTDNVTDWERALAGVTRQIGGVLADLLRHLQTTQDASTSLPNPAPVARDVAEAVAELRDYLARVSDEFEEDDLRTVLDALEEAANGRLSLLMDIVTALGREGHGWDSARVVHQVHDLMAAVEALHGKWMSSPYIRAFVQDRYSNLAHDINRVIRFATPDPALVVLAGDDLTLAMGRLRATFSSRDGDLVVRAADVDTVLNALEQAPRRLSDEKARSVLGGVIPTTVCGDVVRHLAVESVALCVVGNLSDEELSE